MTTGEFIKMLQEVDPSGETHIRMDGGFPIFAEGKLGYWDGSYSYLDENDNYVISDKDYKIDIYCMDIDSFVERNINDETLDNWEEIKSKFIFKLSSLQSVNEEKINRILDIAKNCFDETVEIIKDSRERIKSL